VRYLPIPELTKADVARLWSYVERGDDEECWLWTAGTTAKGYGRFKLNGKLFAATRLVYYLTQGDPGSRHVCHTCDNPPCCNPRHLWLGTASDNNDDSVQKGRYERKTSALRGPRHPNRKYGEETKQHLCTLAQMMTIRDAARLLGLNESSAYKIVRYGHT